MPFRPDIVVTRMESPEVLLVVEVRAAVVDHKFAKAALKSYMVETSCGAGMLVTSEQVSFYRNRYDAYATQAIETIGECSTSELLGAVFSEEISQSELTRLIEDWLESLALGDRTWPPAAGEAIESSILPIVSTGTVRAAGPRWRRAS